MTWLACTTGITAQNEQGLWTIQPMTGINASYLSDLCSRSRVALTGGLEIEYGFTDECSFTLRGMYSTQGGRKKRADDIYREYKTDYATLQVAQKVYFNENIAVFAGGTLGYNVHASKALGDRNIETRKLYIGIPIGLALEYGGITLNTSVVIPTAKTFKNHDGRETVIQMTLGFKLAMN